MSFLRRHAKRIQLAALAIQLIGLLLIMRQLPLDTLADRLTSSLADLGFWGPVLVAAIYAVLTVAMVPGSPLTLAAGAVFGLWLGLLTVSIGSTLGAAMTFLIGRYVARGLVKRQLERYPPLRAVDRAIGQGGWKIVALLRLSPVIPFNLQNYIYGLTSIRFWPCLLASWLCMLPGTLMYVYLGYAAAEGVEAAASEGINWARMIMIGIGLVASIAVAVYTAKLARRKLDEQTDLDPQDEAAAG